MATALRRTWEVHLDAVELQPPTRVGWQHQNLARTDTPAAFQYDRAWLRSSDGDGRVQLPSAVAGAEALVGIVEPVGGVPAEVRLAAIVPADPLQRGDADPPDLQR